MSALFPCFIGILITQSSDFNWKSTNEFSPDEFELLSKHQVQIIQGLQYSKYPAMSYVNQKSILMNSLLLRVQLNFTRIMVANLENVVIFKFYVFLIIRPTIDTWYRTQWADSRSVSLVQPAKAIHVLNNHSRFPSFLDPPTDLSLISWNKMSLNLLGFYNQKESCRADEMGPFRLIREGKYRPRATLFFTLVCLGNFTYGKAEADSGVDRFRRRRGKESKTYSEFVNADSSREEGFTLSPYYTTNTLGYSFVTCYSKQTFSFGVLLKPFEVEVWIVLLTCAVTMLVSVALISGKKLYWSWFEAISLAQLFVISTLLERPTQVPHKLEMKAEFRVLISCFTLVSIILSNLYLGLSITSISAPLESKSITQFAHLAKPGCSWGNVTCYLQRLGGLDHYIQSINYHVKVFRERLIQDDAFWKEVYESFGEVFPSDRNKTWETVLRNSIRRVDIDSDFILLPYSIEQIFSTHVLDVQDFYARLRFHNNKTATNVLKKCKPTCKRIDQTDVANLQLLDLLDPWHIPHPMVGKPSNIIQLENEWDIEHLLVQCGKTALILREDETEWEIRYFDKNYPWLKLFRAESPILKTGIGWSFASDKISITWKIFGRLLVAGIVQLLETWPHMVTPKRENITKKVHSLVSRNALPDKVKSITINGSLQSIFWIYLALVIGVSLEFIVFEQNVIKRMWTNFNTIRKSWKIKWYFFRVYVCLRVYWTFEYICKKKTIKIS